MSHICEPEALGGSSDEKLSRPMSCSVKRAEESGSAVYESAVVAQCVSPSESQGGLSRIRIPTAEQGGGVFRE
jgi:hypothetical protein